MDSILIIDDEPQIRKLLSRMMELEGYEVFQAADCQSTLKQLKLHNPQVVLCDVFLPDGNGVDMVTTIKKLYPELEVILLTAHGNIPDGVQAIKNGAFDYITKGDDNNKIIPLISRAMAQAKKNVGEKVKTEETQSFSFDAIKGKSEGMQQAVALARKVSATDVTVLLTGETGTGKEVFAQAIHRNSLRKENAFVAVNCSAFSKDLLESEIFGHKAGSFTGAMKDKKGLFEVADNGTIFLDEIGEMAFELQAKLLRVLEAGEYIKIGDTKPTKVNVRVISATNRDLKKEIEQGKKTRGKSSEICKTDKADEYYCMEKSVAYGTCHNPFRTHNAFMQNNAFGVVTGNIDQVQKDQQAGERIGKCFAECLDIYYMI